MDYSRFDSEVYSRKDFEFLGPLGFSNLSRVEKVKSLKDNCEYALKIFEKSKISHPEIFEQLVTEKEMLQKCHHPGILKLVDSFTDTDYIYLILEYCSYGDFGKFLSRFASFPFELARFYSCELVSVVSYFHSQGFVHGNLKPSNILISSSLHLKISDFHSLKSSSSSTSKKVGPLISADYISPELLEEGESGAPSDMWALGCVIYQMLVGSPPFTAATQYTTFERIRSGNVEFPLTLPPFAVDLIQSLLLPDPQLRIGVADIEELNTHIFFQGIDIANVYSIHPPDYTSEMLPEMVLESRLIFKDVVKKKCGWIYKKRLLEITEQPSIKYYEPVKMELRKAIEISPQLKVEAKSKGEFQIITPKRVFFFKTLGNSNSEDWVKAVNSLLSKIYGI